MGKVYLIRAMKNKGKTNATLMSGPIRKRKWLVFHNNSVGKSTLYKISITNLATYWLKAIGLKT
jgi:hypothetical protein